MGVKLFNLPDPGEGLVEADIVTWKIKAGDEVKVNDVVVEIETAKSLVELPIPWAGTVVELLVAEGDTVDVGKAIVSIEVAGEESDAPVAPAAASAAGSSAPAAAPAAASAPVATPAASRPGTPRSGRWTPGHWSSSTARTCS